MPRGRGRYPGMVSRLVAVLFRRLAARLLKVLAFLQVGARARLQMPLFVPHSFSANPRETSLRHPR